MSDFDPRPPGVCSQNDNPDEVVRSAPRERKKPIFIIVALIAVALGVASLGGRKSERPVRQSEFEVEEPGFFSWHFCRGMKRSWFCD